MGIRDYVSSATASITGGVTKSREIAGGAVGKASAALPYLGGAWQNTHNLARAASESAIWTTQVVAERMPDREGWERIGLLGLRIADHAIDHGTKPYTFGIPLYKFLKEELGKNKSQEQPVKDAKENMQLDAHAFNFKERIDSLEKEIMELQELKIRKNELEKILVENSSNQKTEKRPKSRDWCPPELIDLIKIE